MRPARTFRSYDEASAWLASRRDYESAPAEHHDAQAFSVGRVERLLAALRRPDRAYDVAQVVGSKGKGATATLLASVLRASGRRTGLFTSPHVVSDRERIRVDLQDADDGAVRDALASLVPHVAAADAAGDPPTSFEIRTVAALAAFRALRCDAVVLEAGMGGRLDATTAARACISVLTSVSLEHTSYLGRTRTAIAREKAGCARAGVPFVSGVPVTTAAGRAVAQECRRAGAPLLAIGQAFEVGRVSSTFDEATARARTTFRLSLPGRAPLDLAVPFLGRHQALNAAVAAVAALRGRWGGARIGADTVRAGLAETPLRARLEVIARAPLTFVDSAHTPASFAALARSLRAALPGRRFVFVVGMSADKDVAGSLRRLHGLADELVATSSGHPRALAAKRLALLARAEGLRASAVSEPSAALTLARRRARPDGVVVVAGSIHLAGAVLANP